MPRRNKPTVHNLIMNEPLWCGGEQKTCAQLFDELLVEGFERKYVDFYIYCLAEHQPPRQQQEAREENRE